MNRNRYIYILLLLVVIACGLISRLNFIPLFIYPYLGDFFYAIMVCVLVALIAKQYHPKHIALYSILLCFAIELQQLYQASWILDIRNNALGGLVLGHGFLWSDLGAYALGVLCFYGVELYAFRRIKKL